MRKAWITLRHQPPYRSDAFADGLEALGFDAQLKFPPDHGVAKDDVVVTWNLNPRYRNAAWQAKKAGAALIVAENGYVSRSDSDELYYALARDGHNGSGYWFTGSEDRWSPLKHEIMPWRPDPKGHILIADQRGIGSEIMRCPRPFYEQVVPKLRRMFVKVDKKAVPEFRLRAHPGRHPSKRTFAQDMEGARAVVTWASNVANEALMLGYPAFRAAPFHVNEAVLSDLNQIIDPPETDRLAAFQKLAWAQWSLSEVQDGTAFRCVLRDVL